MSMVSIILSCEIQYPLGRVRGFHMAEGEGGDEYGHRVNMYNLRLLESIGNLLILICDTFKSDSQDMWVYCFVMVWHILLKLFVKLLALQINIKYFSF